MDVELKPFGCIEKFAILASFGLAGLMLKIHRNQLPRTMTETEMVLRNGTRIPWSTFKRIQVTEIRVHGVPVGTQYMLWHDRGKVVIMDNKILEPQAVIEFMSRRLPSNIQQG